MAGSSSDNPVEVEEEVQTEDADPANTTDEENANENPQEDSTMISRSNQTRKRSLAESSSASDENRRLAPQNRFGAQTSQVVMPPYQNPRLNQFPPSDQMMNQQQRFFIALAASVQTDFNQQNNFPGRWIVRNLSFAAGLGHTEAWRPQIIRPLLNANQHPMLIQLAGIAGMQNQMFIPRPLFVAPEFGLVQQPHLSAYDTYPYTRPAANHQNLRMPLFPGGHFFTLLARNGQQRSFVIMPYRATTPRLEVYSLDDALVVAPLPELNHQTQQPMQLQRFNAGPFSHQGQDQQQQFNQGQLTDFRIDMIPNQASFNASAAAALRELNHQRMQQRQPQTQQLTQSQRFNAGPFSQQGQNQQQQFNRGQHFGLPRDTTRHQVSFNAAAAARPELNHQQMRQLQLQTQQPRQSQRFNFGPFSHQHQDQQQQFNQGQHFGFPTDMIHHRASLNAAAPVARPELNHQQMQQPQPQTQQPIQLQRFTAGPFSHQGQDQQQQFNQGQHFGFPTDMIQHRASLNAAAPVARPELNHQQMQQLQPQMQQPTQSRGFDAGPSYSSSSSGGSV